MQTLDYAHPQPAAMPGDLKAVAWVFIAFGILAGIEIVMAMADSRISINFGVLGIPVGIGILRLSPGWRTCGLVLLWLTMILCGVVGLMSLFGGLLPATLLVLAFFALALWQYRVLTRDNVRRLFVRS
jgi:hypothetical protein